MTKRRPRGLKYKITKINPTSFKKGNKPWNTGTKGLNKVNSGSFKKGEHRNLATEFKRGLSSWNKGRKWVEKMGVNHHNWKGGISTLRNLVYHTFEYRQWRSDVFTKDNFTCVLCGARNGQGKSVCLEADHFPKPFFKIRDEYKIKTLDDALACEELWNINNGRTLCRMCHLKTLKYVQK